MNTSSVFSYLKRKPMLRNVIAVGVLSLFVQNYAMADSSLINITPTPPKIQAATYVLMDYNSGQILAEKGANIKRDPASLTKMMTSYVIGQELKAGKISNDDVVTVGRDAWATGNPIFKGSSLMFLQPGDRVKVSDLNQGIIVDSGNDACVAMADYIAGSQSAFVALMNDYAKALGLTNTTFKTVHGLDTPGQLTTAMDMATLARALIHDLPNEYKIYKQKEFTFDNIKQYNRNTLLWDTSLHVDGMKTGHTDGAGYSLVASATQGNMRLISVVLGTDSEKLRESQSKILLSWGFRFFESDEPVQANKPVTTQPIWFGTTDKIDLGSMNNLYVAVPTGSGPNIKVSYTLTNKDLTAPIKRGDQVGTITVSLDGKTLKQEPLVALNNVDKAGFFGRLVDHVKLFFYGWFH